MLWNLGPHEVAVVVAVWIVLMLGATVWPGLLLLVRRWRRKKGETRDERRTDAHR